VPDSPTAPGNATAALSLLKMQRTGPARDGTPAGPPVWGTATSVWETPTALPAGMSTWIYAPPAIPFRPGVYFCGVWSGFSASSKKRCCSSSTFVSAFTARIIAASWSAWLSSTRLPSSAFAGLPSPA